MSSKEKPLSGEQTSDNGAIELIDELRAIMGVYAKDIKMIREGLDGVDGKNLILLGKKGSEATFQKVMALVDRETKIKSLGKDTPKVTEKTPTEPKEEQASVDDDQPKVRNIQDFALNSKKKA